MINSADVTNENIKEHNQNWPQILDHSYKIFIIRGSESELFNLISQQPDIDEIYLYVKDPYEAKYQLLINKIERFKVFK